MHRWDPQSGRARCSFQCRVLLVSPVQEALPRTKPTACATGVGQIFRERRARLCDTRFSNALQGWSGGWCLAILDDYL